MVTDREGLLQGGGTPMVMGMGRMLLLGGRNGGGRDGVQQSNRAGGNGAQQCRSRSCTCGVHRVTFG